MHFLIFHLSRRFNLQIESCGRDIERVRRCIVKGFFAHAGGCDAIREHEKDECIIRELERERGREKSERNALEIEEESQGIKICVALWKERKKKGEKECMYV